MTPNSPKTTQERKEKGGKRGEKRKRRTPGTHTVFILPTLNDKKALATHRLRHLDRAVPFSKIRVDMYIGKSRFYIRAPSLISRVFDCTDFVMTDCPV